MELAIAIIQHDRQIAFHQAIVDAEIFLTTVSRLPMEDCIRIRTGDRGNGAI